MTLESVVYDEKNQATPQQEQAIVDFLFSNLEQYGDPKKDIQNCLNYAFKRHQSFGGFVMTLQDQGQLKAVTIINHTGMGGYIPENILVYIATDKKSRGQGLGKKLMKTAIEYCQGDIALHVEKDNPARFLYEKLGFTNPYLEMRLRR